MNVFGTRFDAPGASVSGQKHSVNVFGTRFDAPSASVSGIREAKSLRMQRFRARPKGDSHREIAIAG